MKEKERVKLKEKDKEKGRVIFLLVKEIFDLKFIFGGKFEWWGFEGKLWWKLLGILGGSFKYDKEDKYKRYFEFRFLILFDMLLKNVLK